MKRIKYIILVITLIVSLISCKTQLINIATTETNDFVTTERRTELSEIALLENYTVSEPELLCDLTSFLLNANEGSKPRSVNLPSYNFTKIDSAKMQCFNNSNLLNRSALEENYDDIEFYIYQINNESTDSLGYAFLSNDRRIGEIIAITDNSDFNADITNDVFMQLFCSSFESYVEETVEIWNSLTSEDLQNARNAYAGISSSGNYEYSQWKYNYGNISNLLATKWNQQDPYNSAIKAIKGQNYPAGCGTTAVAQIMAFHEFPKTCDETIKNTLKNNWSLANSWDGTYNWNLLKSSS